MRSPIALPPLYPTVLVSGLALALAGAASASPVAEAAEAVQVEWFEEAVQGGVTMIFLGVLSVALVAFAIERAVRLRRSKIVPPGLVERLRAAPDARAAAQIASETPGALGAVATHLIKHRKGDPQLALTVAGDIGARYMAAEDRRTTPFAVIAAIAPLLGLLGTMIGMIESFKLVEVYGDEGGASLLAGSISKALITTAAGLIIAIPAVALYHLFRTRTLAAGAELERAAEELFDHWYGSGRPTRPAVTPAPRSAASTGEATS